MVAAGARAGAGFGVSDIIAPGARGEAGDGVGGMVAAGTRDWAAVEVSEAVGAGARDRAAVGEGGAVADRTSEMIEATPPGPSQIVNASNATRKTSRSHLYPRPDGSGACSDDSANCVPRSGSDRCGISRCSRGRD